MTPFQAFMGHYVVWILLAIVGIRLWFQYTRHVMPRWLDWTTTGLLIALSVAISIDLFAHPYPPLRPTFWTAFSFLPIPIVLAWFAWHVTHKEVPMWQNGVVAGIVLVIMSVLTVHQFTR